MKFKQPDADAAHNIEGTVILPAEDGKYPEKLFSRVISRRDDQGGTVKFEKSLFDRKDNCVTVDLEGLALMAWEHRQYSAAQEFSPAHLDVLREVQRLSNDGGRILSQDIQEALGKEYADSTISNALTRLVEKDLVKREANGVYRYRGFEEWTPPED
jgi:hypothetical protein